MMGNRSILLVVFVLFALVIAISRIPHTGSSAIQSESHPDNPQEPEADKAISNSKSQFKTKSHKAADKPKNRMVSSEPPRKMERKLHLTRAANSEDNVVSQKPLDQELEGLPLALRDRHWKIWKGVTSVPEHIFQNRGNRNVMGKINGYILTGTNHSPSLEAFSLDNPVVVYNERLDQPGIITGKLKIKLKYQDEVQDVLREHNLNAVDSFPDIKLYYVSPVSQPFDLSQLFKTLKQDNRIESIEAEVLDRQYEKR